MLSQKKYEDASMLYQRGYEKTLGLDHPTAVACSKHYAAMLEEMKTEMGQL